MIFDKTQMAADNLAHDGTVTEIDLGSAGQGRGEPVEIFFQGHGLTAAGAVTLALETGDTSGGAYVENVLHTFANAADANKGHSVYLPADGLTPVERYLNIALAGTSGGTFTAGLVLRGGHHNP
jgi:hypothetical protein